MADDAEPDVDAVSRGLSTVMWQCGRQLITDEIVVRRREQRFVQTPKGA